MWASLPCHHLGCLVIADEQDERTDASASLVIMDSGNDAVGQSSGRQFAIVPNRLISEESIAGRTHQ